MKIFSVILGWILIISGIIFLFKSERARNKMLGQGFGVIKGVLVAIVLYAVLLLLSLSGKAHGALGVLILLTALVAIIAFFKLKKKIFLNLQEKFKKIPVKVLKIYAVIQIIIGILMVLLKYRIV
ncbi:MAG: hypothetical protein PHP17_03860 [Candidatus Omnitrophica bacterium]|nr:hypothetical protein [Candidatus Omnitrophota bacterium]